MSTGATLSALRTRLRDLLNEPTAGFWTDAQLNRYLATAYKRFYLEAIKLNPDFATRYYDITYTAGAASVNVSITDSFICREVYGMEDRTTSTPGPMMQQAESLEELHSCYANEPATVISGFPAKWYLKNVESTAAGVITQQLTIYVAPYPASAMTLRMHYRAEPQELSTADTYTTGLSAEWDECVVYGALVLARMQEENSGGAQSAQTMVEASFVNAARLTRPIMRNSARVRYYPDD